MQQKNTRIIELEGSFNFRDLGGYETRSGHRVKWGKLFRSGNLAKLTNSDIDLVTQLGINRILDLRGLEEISLNPTPEIKGVKGIHIQVIPNKELSDQENPSVQAAIHTNENEQQKHLILDGPTEKFMTDLYGQMVSFADAFQQVFKELLEQPERPLLFHCMVGKDRTGIASALILSALGVSRETILEDYTLTNESFDKIKAALVDNGDNEALMSHDLDSIQALLEARPVYLETFFAQVEEQFGSVDNYLSQAIGLTKENIQFLQKNYLEEI